MNSKLVGRLALVCVGALWVLGCGGDGGAAGTAVAKIAAMEVDPPTGIQFNYGSVDVGDTKSELVSIINTGNLTLDIASVTLEYEPANPALETSPETWAFQLAFNPGEEPPFSVAYQGSGEAGLPETWFFRVSVTNLGDDLPRSATLVIESNDKDTPTYRLPVEAISGVPRIRVTPEVVDFDRVGVDQEQGLDVIVRNQGSADLVIDRFVFTGADVFRFEYGDLSIVPDTSTQSGVDFAQPLVLPADASATLRFVFAPVSEHPANATFVLFSNDPDATQGTVIQLFGNQEVPCIQVTPTQVDFGAVMPGYPQALPVEIRNCGTSALTLTGVSLEEDTSGGAFSEHLEGLFPGGEPTPISEESPYVLMGNQAGVLEIRYSPSQLSPIGADGNPIPDTALLRILNDSFYATLGLQVRGVSSEILCPTAIITVEEGEQVIPQTVLHLHGDQSFSPNGQITSYQWTVTQPQGSVSTLIPTPTFPNPIFEANIAGKYIFTLEVVDSTGVKSCYPAQKEVYVVPDEAIHIELLWRTPNDPDETDEGPAAGSDMDLHFAHMFASGPDIDGDSAPDPWFNYPYDVFWFNARPDWGSFDPSIDDDPGLDRDDTDGGGPENVNLNIPEGVPGSAFTYRVAVHYWDDKNFGEAFATVRVYIYSALVFEVPDVKLYKNALWEVCSVEWPSTTVKLLLDQSGQYKITPNYQNPLFNAGL